MGKDFTLKEVRMYTCSDAPIADYLIIHLVTNAYMQYMQCLYMITFSHHRCIIVGGR